MSEDKQEKADGHNLSDLERFARERISASHYPDDYHPFKPAACSACGVVPMALTIEHHTGSKERDFRGVVFGLCTKCGKKEQIFTFTGKQRKRVREEKPVCKCGSDYFYIGECERIERDDGMLGFFDEGVFVGKCSECGKNRAFFTRIESAKCERCMLHFRPLPERRSLYAFVDTKRVSVYSIRSESMRDGQKAESQNNSAYLKTQYIIENGISIRPNDTLGKHE